jgi:hypothetical protein
MNEASHLLAYRSIHVSDVFPVSGEDTDVQRGEGLEEGRSQVKPTLGASWTLDFQPLVRQKKNNNVRHAKKLPCPES